MTRKGLVASAAVAAAMLTPVAANAALEKFSFSYNGSIDLGAFSVSGSGFVFGSLVSSGTYLLTSGYGTSPDAGSLSLEPAGINTLAPSVNLTSDNLLSPGIDPVLTGGGLVFEGSSLAANSKYFNIWGNGPGSYTYFNNYDRGAYSSGPVSFSITDLGALPEPATWAMLGIGLAALGFVGYRKKREARTISL